MFEPSHPNSITNNTNYMTNHNPKHKIFFECNSQKNSISNTPSHSNRDWINNYNLHFIQQTKSPNYLQLPSQTHNLKPQIMSINTPSKHIQTQYNNTISPPSSFVDNPCQYSKTPSNNNTKNIATIPSSLHNSINNSLKHKEYQSQTQPHHHTSNIFGIHSPVHPAAYSHEQKQSFNTIFNITPNNNTALWHPSQSENQIDINKYQLSVFVSSYETKKVGNDEVTFYKIDIYSDIAKKEWSVYHQYNDFYELHNIFVRFYTNPPYFPSQPLMTLNNISDWFHRKEALKTYMKDVSNRADLLTSLHCVKFLKLLNHHPDLLLYSPLEMYHLSNELSFPITCSSFHSDCNWLFLGMGKADTTVLNGIINKVKFLNIFSKTQQPNILGQLVIYNIIKNYQGCVHFEPWYSKPLYSEITCINYYKVKNCLCLGWNNGNVALFKIYINESTQETDGELVVDAGMFRPHNAPILGVVVNFSFGYVYTISKSITLKINEWNYQTLMKEISITKQDVSIMKYDDIWGRLLLGDIGGSVYVIDIVNSALAPKTLKILNCTNSQIHSLSLFLEENLLFVAIKNEGVMQYHVHNYKDKIVTRSYIGDSTSIDFIKVKEYNVPNKVNVNDTIVTSKNEVLFAMSNGSIAVYKENDCLFPQYVIAAHSHSVNNIFWDEDRRVLISCSEDKSVKMYQFPVYLPGEMMWKKETQKKRSDNRVDNLNLNKDGTIFIESNSDLNKNKIWNDTVLDNNERDKDGFTYEEIWSMDWDGWALEVSV